MNKKTKVIATLLILVSHVYGARLDRPEPDEAPVHSVKIVEKGNDITMTVAVGTSYNLCSLETVAVLNYKKDETFKHKLTKNGGNWTFTFTVPKDKLKKSWIHLGYYMKDGKNKHLNAVNLDVEKLYNHYKKKK